MDFNADSDELFEQEMEAEIAKLEEVYATQGKCKACLEDQPVDSDGLCFSCSESTSGVRRELLALLNTK